MLLACHMDEIGFYVKHVDDKGFVRVHNVGGFDTRNLFARRVLVQASGGGDLIGLMNPGGRPIHIAKEEDKKKIPEITEFYVDLCLPRRGGEEESPHRRPGHADAGVRRDRRVRQRQVHGQPRRRRSSRSRRCAKRKKPKYEVILAATVQEEVGCRGAGPGGVHAEPDIAIAIDTTLAVDTPGVPEDERVTKQGDGVALTIMDSLTISRPLADRRVRGRREETEHPLPAQHPPPRRHRRRPDAAPPRRLPRDDASVPTRYIHTVTECIHKRDLQGAIDCWRRGWRGSGCRTCFNARGRLGSFADARCCLAKGYIKIWVRLFNFNARIILAPPA